MQHVDPVKLQGGATGTITFQMQQPDGAGFQTMKWSTVDNVTVTAGNTTTVNLP